MIVILAIDGLEYDSVTEFGCKNLMQECYGKTDLSDFEQPRTIVLWSSFLAGKNLEKEILARKELWSFALKPEQTFLSHFKSHLAIDVPGYNYIKEHHDKERELLKAFFDKKSTIEEYDAAAFEHHKMIKMQFFEALDAKKQEIILGYFSLADVVGHLSFGIKSKMRMIYQEFDEISRQIKEKINCPLLIVSDHGMEAIGRFGDHSNHGFWSASFKTELSNPKPTDFAEFIKSIRKSS